MNDVHDFRRSVVCLRRRISHVPHWVQCRLPIVVYPRCGQTGLGVVLIALIQHSVVTSTTLDKVVGFDELYPHPDVRWIANCSCLIDFLNGSSGFAWVAVFRSCALKLAFCSHCHVVDFVGF